MGRPRSWVEVDLGRIRQNYISAMREVGGRAEAIAVVKSNAYGHGDAAVARALYECGVRSFAVASIDEAMRLRSALRGFSRFDGDISEAPMLVAHDKKAVEISTSVSLDRGSAGYRQRSNSQSYEAMGEVSRDSGDAGGLHRASDQFGRSTSGAASAISRLNEAEILILGYTPPELIDELTDEGIVQTLISEEYARELASRISGRHAGRIRTHLAIDTGMHRIGARAEDIGGLTALAESYKRRLGIRASFTHLCCADGDDADDVEFTRLQISRFYRAVTALRGLGIEGAHLLNSAGMLRYARGLSPILKSTVRPGIILYGIGPSSGASLPLGIRPALSLKAKVAMVNTLARGESIGYGRAFTAKRSTVVATLPIGYADGYPRSLSGKGYVMIADRRAPILGRVCMNQTMVDISGIDGVSPGDEVTLIGDGASADEVAALAGTISYEIITRISAELPRIYKDS